jgi:hypothetical protein
MKIKKIFIEYKGLRRAPNIVITRFIKPSQGRSSKYYNKRRKNITGIRKRRENYFFAGDSSTLVVSTGA